MPRSRQLITDFSSGEVSPRINTRADWEGYPKACREIRGWIVAQQGGVMLRRGFEHVGPAMTDGSDGSNVILIEWRGGATPDQRDILFELVGNRLRGWTVDGQIMDGDDPYEIEVPGLPFNLKPDSLQTAQRGNMLVLANATVPPILITVKREDEWEVSALPPAAYPRRRFDDDDAPFGVSTALDVTFIDFQEGDNFVVTGSQFLFDGSGIISTRTVVDAYTADTTQMEKRIKDAVRRVATLSDLIDDPVVVYDSGTTYQIFLPMNAQAATLVIRPGASVPGDRRVAIDRQRAGEPAVEPAWSFPLTVQYDGRWWLCLQSHVAVPFAGEDGAEPGWVHGTPDTLPAYWQELDDPPIWEGLAPSMNWVGDIYFQYSPRNRGFPSAVVFHEQRLIFGGTKDAPATLWGSELGQFRSFSLGAEADNAWSIDLDSSESPYIRWLESQNGLWCGTSAGLWLLTAQVTLSPTDIKALRYTADRCERRPPTVAGNEVMFIPSGRRQLRTIRFNQDYGPYETFELSMLAEHLGRCGVRRIVYCQQPQPMVYLLVDTPGRIVAISYSRQGEMAAFSTIEVDGLIEDIGSTFEQRFDIGDEGNFDVLWAVVRRGMSVTLERIQYPVTINPCATLTPTTTKHLDGWVVRDSVSGKVSGLEHLQGREVTVINSDGTLQATGVAVPEQVMTPGADITVPNGTFDTDIAGWDLSGFAVASWSSYLGGSLRLGATWPFLPSTWVETQSLISVNEGQTHIARVSFENSEAGVTETVTIEVRNASGTVIASRTENVSGVSFNFVATLPLTFVATDDEIRIRVRLDTISTGSPAVYITEVSLESQDMIGEVEIDAEGEGLIIGQPFSARLETLEPVGGNPTGPSMGNKKRWSELMIRIYESAMPLVNGQRPSDHDQADPRATPERLRSGVYKISSLGHNDGAVVISQDLPYQTQVIGVFGDMQTGSGD